MSLAELHKEPQPSYYAKVIQDLKDEITALKAGYPQLERNYNYLEKLQAENAALRQQLKQDVQFGQQAMQMVGRKDEKIAGLLSVIDNLYDMIVSMDTHKEADEKTRAKWAGILDNPNLGKVKETKHAGLLRATGYLK